MLKYFHIIKFLITHDLTKLKVHWESELICNKSFKWRRVFRRYRETLNVNKKYFFWWRLANEMFSLGNEKEKIIAHKLQSKLISKYNIDIALGARIGKNFTIGHNLGIVITETAIIGDNVIIRQNTTIGRKTVYVDSDYREKLYIKIGDNVDIGANSCIIGDKLTIGNNVKIGAMSFINKDIADNSIVFTKKTTEIKQKTN
ncbi:hypothetical protein RCS94_03710 [Orbaceae bacterium ac157xtp]